jgi:hypothetical protein
MSIHLAIFSSLKIQALSCGSLLKDFIDRGLHKDYDVIGIDEAQFFEDVSDYMNLLFR